MPQESQATQEPSGKSSRTKSFQGHRYSKPSARRTGPLLTRSRISSRRDLSGPEGGENYPLHGHGAAPTSTPGGVLRLMPSTSTRDACLTSSGLLWAGIVGYAGLDGELRAMGRSREELFGATPSGTAGCRPNRGCGPRAAAEAARHNVAKPHRPWTDRDAGREWASGAASRSRYLKVPLVAHLDRRSKCNIGGRSRRRRTWRS